MTKIKRSRRELGARALVAGVCLLLTAMRPAAAQIPVPGQESLRLLIESMEQGHTRLDLLYDDDVRIWKNSQWTLEKMVQNWGPLETITYRLTSVHRFLVFDVTFAHAHSIWKITTVSADGHIGGLDFWRYDPDRHPFLQEGPCLGATTTSGIMMWTPIVVAMKEYRCLAGKDTGGMASMYYGGNDWNSAVEGEDMKVSLNLAFDNPADAAKVKPWTKAEIRGHIWREDEFMAPTPEALHAEQGFHETEYLVVRSAQVVQEPSANPILALSSLVQVPAAQAAPPMPGPPAPAKSDPHLEAALRHLIDGIAQGKPDLAALTPDQADHVRRVQTGLHGTLHDAGAIIAVTALATGSDGQQIYAVSFEHGANQFSLKLNDAGLIEAFSYGPHLTGPADTSVTWKASR
jgi:hypothetical protein